MEKNNENKINIHNDDNGDYDTTSDGYDLTPRIKM